MYIDIVIHLYISLPIFIFIDIHTLEYIFFTYKYIPISKNCYWDYSIMVFCIFTSFFLVMVGLSVELHKIALSSSKLAKCRKFHLVEPNMVWDHVINQLFVEGNGWF